MKIKNGDAYLGDCLEIMDNLIQQGIQVDAIITDPPYGTTACKRDQVIPFDLMREQLKRVIKPNGAIVLFGSQPFTSRLICSNIDMFKYERIWEKDKPSNPAIAKYQPLKYHESISIFGGKNYYPVMTKGNKNHSVGKGIRRGGGESNMPNATHSYQNDPESDMKYPKSVIKINRETKPVHPTQKPVALIEYLVKTYTNEGETVLDFTMGSGTTAVACMNTGRNFIGFELDEQYYNMANKRIENLSANDI